MPWAFSEAPIYIDDSATTNVMEIRTKARRLKAEKGLGLIVIDYLQLMEGRARIENRVQEIAQITRALKGIARELKYSGVSPFPAFPRRGTARPAIPKLAHLGNPAPLNRTRMW